MKVQLDAQVKAVDQLKGNTRMLENKLSEAKSKKDTLKARAKSASTSKQINEMLQGLNTSSASSAFDRMEEKVMALEGESEAAMQVFDLKPPPPPGFPLPPTPPLYSSPFSDCFQPGILAEGNIHVFTLCHA